MSGRGRREGRLKIGQVTRIQHHRATVLTQKRQGRLSVSRPQNIGKVPNGKESNGDVGRGMTEGGQGVGNKDLGRSKFWTTDRRF